MLIESSLPRSRIIDERLVRGDDGRLEKAFGFVVDRVGDARPLAAGLLRRDRVEFIVTFFKMKRFQFVLSLLHVAMLLPLFSPSKPSLETLV